MYESLHEMPFRLQMQNVGAEVARAIRFQAEGKPSRVQARANTAVAMLQEMKKNATTPSREKELDFMAEEILDFANGSPKYNTNPKSLLHQYDIFSD